jgi:hypothetical protein
MKKAKNLSGSGNGSYIEITEAREKVGEKLEVSNLQPQVGLHRQGRIY